MEQVFWIDGVAFPVRVLELTRKFTIEESSISGKTLDGQKYRDLYGTYYHYTMTVAARDEDPQALEAFWEAISSPAVSHVCVFPYGQKTLTQRMYVTGGEQALKLIRGGVNHWDSISVNFIAMGPEVVP